MEMAAANRLRAAALFGGLLATLLAVYVPAAGQVAVRVRGGSNEGLTGASFILNGSLQKRLTRARQQLDAKNYAAAIEELQRVLDEPEDAFFQPRVKDAEDPAAEAGAKGNVYRSLKAEAQELLGGMPAEGLDAYETQFGPLARQMLQTALADDRRDSLQVVARRFFHTAAGYDALYRLAADHFDRGRALAAALCLDRLRKTPRARNPFEPALSLRLAAAWLRAGQPEDARAVLLELKGRTPGDTLTLAGRKVPLFVEPDQSLDWLRQQVGALGGSTPAGLANWPMPRGDASRNASGLGGSPYLNTGWRTDTIAGSSGDPELDELLKKMVTERQAEFRQASGDRGLPALPSVQPIVVGNLVIARGFGNTHAYDLTTGRLKWASAEVESLVGEVASNAKAGAAQPQGASPAGMLTAQRAWRDATFGQQSSDGERVFVVEDLGFVGPWAFNQGVVHPFAPRADNRLAAYDVKSGKLLWKAGAPLEDQGDPLAGAFFLGAPLPLGNLLYTLVESQDEVRLVALDPRSGQVDWTQTLVQPDTGLRQDPSRRTLGLSPAYSAGVMVCPTESGAIVALDLTTRSLLWGYRYSAATQYDARFPRVVAIQQQMLNRNQGFAGNDTNRWLDSLPIIAEGKVFIAPREAGEVHCLSLRDGTRLWDKPRGEGLYLAGVHEGKLLVVARNGMHAIRLDNGEAAWAEPVALPVPSGRGFLSGDMYHVPLTSAEVATVDVRSGRVLARAQSREGNIPGNLVGLQNAIISQQVDSVEFFKPLETLSAEVAQALALNPDDPAALALRGEIALQKRQLAEAYTDLKRALELKSDDARVRRLLVGSLLEGLRVDFTAYRANLAEIEALASSPEDRSTYLRLLAAGLEKAGERQAAFDVYLQFTEPRVAAGELERLEDGLLVRHDRLVQARTKALLETSTAEDRQAMLNKLHERYAGVKERQNRDELRRLLDYFGDALAGDDAVRLLVDLETADGNWLDLEHWLCELQHTREKPAAGEATARLARVLLDASRPMDARPLVVQLQRDWADTPLLDGKTGGQLAEEWLSDEALTRVAQVSWPTGATTVEKLPLQGQPQGIRSYRLNIEGRRGTFGYGMSFEIDQRGQELLARDALGRPLWKVNLPSGPQWANVMISRISLCDHLVILSSGNHVVAIDSLGTAAEPGARILWQQSLSDPLNANPNMFGVNARAIVGAGGVQKFIATDQLGQPLGGIGPVTHRYVALQRGRKLMALDPLSGKPLWVRDDVTPGADLFGDEEILIAVPSDGDQALVFRATDGGLLANQRVPAASRRLAFVGRQIITLATEAQETQLGGFDPVTGETIWTRKLAAGSRARMLLGEELVALQPDGKLLILAADGRELLSAQVDPVNNLQQVIAFRNDQTLTVIVSGEVPQNQNQRVMQSGMHSVLIQGTAYGFEIATGKRLWATPIDRQGLDLTQPGSLPILAFTCQYIEQAANGRGFESAFGMLLLDQRTGKVVYTDKQRDEPLITVELVGEPEQKRLDVRMFRSVLRVSFADPEKRSDTSETSGGPGESP